MRAGLSTIQQTLTPEAAAVLNRSIAEAARRNHGQTTPLHVAATLLAAPSGLLRQACIRSHPTSSHPLQCRALELCFSVALDRLPSVNPPTTASSNPSANASDPPISNALMAALKRAQAHQRRGCPEQQQQPLLAVKVELEQLVVSILDDPSVSRVMREASFSSPAVKGTIEQSLSATATSTTTTLGLSQRPPLAARNLYMNPLLHPHQGITDPSRKDEVSRVLDIMTRSKKRNPVLVADSDQAAVMREVLKKIEAGEAPPTLRAAHVIPLEKEFCTTPDRSQIPATIKELGSSIEARIGDGSGRGVVLDLGDLKWLVESPAGLGNSLQIVSETGRAAAAEMAKLLQRFGERVWILGTASCATFLRCQVYHPTMENDWDLQAVPIAPRSPAPVMFPRLGGNGILSSSVESLAPIKGFPTVSTAASPTVEPATPIKGFPALSTAATPLRRSTDPFRVTTLCAACMENYERELGTLSSKEFEKSCSHLKPEARQALPRWMQSANPVNTKPTSDSLQCKEQELMGKQSTDELLKRWHETCSRLHPSPNPLLIARERPPAQAFLMPTTNNSITLPPPRTPLQTKLTLTQSTDQASKQYSRLPERRPSTPPGSPVKTDLVLGHPKASAAEKAHSERVKDFTECMQDGFSDKKADKDPGFPDYDSFKRLFKGLVEKVAWQQEAVSAVATTVMNCKSGNGKPRGAGPKGDTWLLFLGPDKVGKRKMAAALSELVFGTGPVSIDLSGGRHAGGEDGELDTSFRGRTALDRVSDAVRQNPLSVVVLEDIDRADMLVRASIKRTIERGRIVDSQGREVGLGSAIFVLTAGWLPDELKSTHDSFLQCEERILNSANCGWQLELSVSDKTGKRGDETVCDGDRPTKLKKGLSGGAALSLDLNLAAGVEDDTGEGSRNSSDLTVEHGQETVRLAMSCPALSSASELMGFVHEAIVFKPVDFGLLKRKALESICTKFAGVMGCGRLIQVDDEALDRMVGGVWLAGAGDARGFEEWADKVLVPSMQQLQSKLKLGDGSAIVRLSVVKAGQRRWTGGDWLPATVAIAVDGL